jgi:chaperone required for assembly of F1-ATPase
MKRFYKDVTVLAEDGGFRVALDGRGIRTQGGRPQIVPSAALAQAMAAEWALQGETIDTARFAFRDMADYAIDVSPPIRRPRAGPAALCRDRYAVLSRRAGRTAGRPPAPAVGTARHHGRGAPRRDVYARIGRDAQAATRSDAGRARPGTGSLSPFALAALRNTTSLAASLIIGLAALDPAADIPALWDAACVEEDWQAELWGKDDQAQAHRTRRGQAFAKAAEFAHLL